MLLEPEIQDGMRCFPTAQKLFVGASAHKLIANPIDVGWYGTGINPYLGAFMVVQEGAGLDYLIGDFCRLTYKHRRISVYCLGRSPDIDYPISVTRRAFLGLARLSRSGISVHVDTLK